MWGLLDQMELTDGVLYRKWQVEGSNATQKQLVVPQGLRETVLEQLHDSKLSGGHFAFQKTLDRARQRFWWPNMRKDFERKCENCTLCQARKRTTAEDVARAIVENWVLTFEAPDCLHTDQGARFSSELLLEVCKKFGIEKNRTSPYHPQGNGMVDRHNRVVADVISKYCANNPSSWDQIIFYLNL
ncbi:uncharacterized protein LOC142336176 [Convolutriloba macropyga]|uniref:uncharacterized protein LOC142336176 n=1 Tax=Convolutriloba macropyga TaxID=536237 RepID=UPI003F51AE5B